MDFEHGPSGTIDAKTLVEQNGENVGNISAVEFSPGHIQVQNNEDSESVFSPDEKPHPIIEGLPAIGADAENEKRSKKIPDGATDKIFLENDGFTGENRPEKLNMKEVQDIYFDEAGTEAMIAEVSRRAETLVPNASKELRDAIRVQAVANFKNELESKKAERQAIADSEAQEILDKLKAGKSLDELEKEQITPTTQQGETAWIDEEPHTDIDTIATAHS